MHAKTITWNPDTKDYDLTLDGEFVGSASSFADGESVLDRLVADRLVSAAGSLDSRIAQLSDAYKAAKADGRRLDASLYRRMGLELLAEKYGVSVAELTAQKAA